MTLGELRDPEPEFFVLKAAQRPDEENVWRDLFFIDRTQLPTEIPIELAKKILLTGFFFFRKKCSFYSTLMSRN